MRRDRLSEQNKLGKIKNPKRHRELIGFSAEDAIREHFRGTEQDRCWTDVPHASYPEFDNPSGTEID